MNPKPLHRSLTFWSGIFMMLSITGAWWDSKRANSYLARYPYVAITGHGMISLQKNTFPSIPTAGRMKHDRSLYPGPSRPIPPFFARGAGQPYQSSPEEESYLDAARRMMRSAPRDNWLLMVPYWLLLLLTLAAWTAGLYLRDRRHARAMDEMNKMR